jgi:hypothetical protein
MSFLYCTVLPDIREHPASVLSLLDSPACDGHTGLCLVATVSPEVSDWWWLWGKSPRTVKTGVKSLIIVFLLQFLLTRKEISFLILYNNPSKCLNLMMI